jgi:hypothetical protein
MLGQDTTCKLSTNSMHFTMMDYDTGHVCMQYMDHKNLAGNMNHLLLLSPALFTRLLIKKQSLRHWNYHQQIKNITQADTADHTIQVSAFRG